MLNNHKVMHCELSSTHVLKIESTEISDMKDDLQKFWALKNMKLQSMTSFLMTSHLPERDTRSCYQTIIQ